MHDNGTAKVDSLWSGGDAAALDMPAIAYRLRAHGFNALRLPFTFADLRAPVTKEWERQGCRKVRGALMCTLDWACAAPCEQGRCRHQASDPPMMRVSPR